MKRPTICHLSTCLLAAAASPSLLAHPGHIHTPGLFDNLVHTLVEWPAIPALCLILLAGICWSWLHGAR